MRSAAFVSFNSAASKTAAARIRNLASAQGSVQCSWTVPWNIQPARCA